MTFPFLTPLMPPVGAATASVQTRLSISFEHLLPAFAAFVESESDLENISYNDDPVLSFWTRDRDRAEVGLTKCLAHLCQLPVCHPEDRPLHRFGLLLSAMLDEKEPSYPRQLRRDMKVMFVTHYQVSGFGPRATYGNAMLAQAWHLTDALVKLSRFDFCPESAFDQPVVDDLAAFLAPDF
jgi:hypothetical protein